jgi:DNA-binding HxlR family transcriptional regulator
MSPLLRAAALFHHRWSAPILAEMHREGGATRFVVLLNRLGISRDVLSRTLRALIRQGWVRRNPGYGHPLRPEYLLTKSGARLAPECAALISELERQDQLNTALHKWSLPILLATVATGGRFSELKAVLTGITARALVLSLKELHAAGLVERAIVAGFPPSSRYEATPFGKRLVNRTSRVVRAI